MSANAEIAGRGRSAAAPARYLPALLCCAALPWFGACGEAPDERPVPETPVQSHQWEMRIAETGNEMATESFARMVGAMSGGRLRVALVPAAPLPAAQVLAAVATGKAQIAHTGALQVPGLSAALQFFGPVPFGMTRQELNAWLYYGGGMELLQELYAPHGALPLPGGGSGISLGGWFERRLQQPRDLRGLKVQVSGLAAQVYSRLGARPVTAAGKTLYARARDGDLDAATATDSGMGLCARLQTLGGYCYYPGWQAPARNHWFLLNREAFDALPADLQAIVRVAAAVVDQEMLEHGNTRNADTLQELQVSHGARFLPFPENLVRAFYRASRETIAGLAASDPAAQRVHDSYRKFFDTVRPWHETSDLSAMNLRR